MTEKGQVTVPSAARARRKLGYKSTLVFFESASGDMILRPSKASPELDLVDHLRRFKGIEIPELEQKKPVINPEKMVKISQKGSQGQKGATCCRFVAFHVAG